MTLSIVAYDPAARPGPEWGVAVASKFLAVGALVPFARAGVGAGATQAFANLHYADTALDLLGGGKDAQAVIDAVTSEDELRGQRQLGVVDRLGNTATFTGEECFEWAGGHAGEGYCCQGNILTGPNVVEEMTSAFESTHGELAVRLLAAIEAGDRAGGDRRGRQSAALFVVREGGGYGGGNDVAIDLRADDNAAPIGELKRLYDLHRLYFPRPEDLDFIDADEGLARRLRAALTALGYEPGGGEGYDDALKEALFQFVGTENLEERWSDESRVERSVLAHLFTSAEE